MGVFAFQCIGIAAVAMCSMAHASTFRFDTDPFAGSPVLTTPGRQIVGGEEFISFSTATDVFSLESSVFGVESSVDFVNAPAQNLPAGGVNVIVLQSFDDDNNPLTPFGAGNAANLIADRISTPGPGFFVYFNQSLDLPRLVFDTDLSSHDSDLKILARILNLNGATGRNAIPSFKTADFEITTTSQVPEPSTWPIIAGLATVGTVCHLLRRRRQRAW